MKSPLHGLTKEDLEDLTSTMTDAQIGELFGVTRTAATYHRKKYGVRSLSQRLGQRQYKDYYEPAPGAKRAYSHRRGCNERCFFRIDDGEAAYWLGLLAADGWIVTHHQQLTGVSLALHSRDIDLLKGYADFVGFRGDPRRTRPNSELYQVKISSRVMAEDLALWGVVPRKSKILELPQLPKELMPHFLRGLFDGDGSVGGRGESGRSLFAQLTTGSELLATQVKAVVDPETSRPCSVGRDREAFVLRWYADNALSLARYMYQGNPSILPRMERKAAIFFGCQGSGAGHS